MELTPEQKETFGALTLLLMQFMATAADPHCKIIVTSTSAEFVQSKFSTVRSFTEPTPHRSDTPERRAAETLRDSLRRRTIAQQKKGRSRYIKDALAKYGARTVTDLPPECFALFHMDLVKIEAQ